MAGNGKIYDKIDSLKEARTVDDLVARLTPILNELAYYVATGEGVVMETHEEWHTDFTDRLYDAVADEKKVLPSGGMAARPVPHPVPQIMQRPGPPRMQKVGSGGRPQSGARRTPDGGFTDSSERTVPLPVSSGGRPRPGDLSPALRSIMEGTHPSFTEQDYH